MIPGQYSAKLFLIEVARRTTMAYASLKRPSGSGPDQVKVIQFLSWKFNYMRKNVSSAFSTF